MRDWTGTRIAARYRLQDRLARGARGFVYRAWDELLGRQVALKVFRCDEDDPEAADRFRREAQVVAHLHHPRIVPIYDFGTWNHWLFFTMPVVMGESLRRVLERGPLAAERVAVLGAQLADALDYSHARGIVHRDLKPENVMVSWREGEPPRVSLLDFGIAHELGSERRTLEQVFRGTALYASPEQLSDEPVDARCDIWSLGVVLYECLAGRPPFQGERLEAIFFKILTADPAPLGLDGLGGRLEALCLACIRRERAARPQTMAEVLRRLSGDAAREGARPAGATVRGGETGGVGTPGEAWDDDEPTVQVFLPRMPEMGPVFDWAQLGDRLLIQGDYRAAHQAYEAARRERLQVPRRVVRNGFGCLKLGRLAMKLGHYEEALRRCDACLEHAGDDAAQRVRAESLATLVELAAGDLARADARCESATRHLARLDPPPGELTAAVLRAHGNLWLARGKPGPALDAFLQAVEDLESAAPSGTEPRAAGARGGSSADLRSMEHRWELSIQLYNVAEAAHRLGDADRAWHDLDRAEALKVALGDRWGLAYVHLLRARLDLDAGRLGRAQHHADLAASIAEAIGDPKVVARSLLVAGRVQAACGRYEAARASYRRALETAEDAGCRPEADEAIEHLQTTRGDLAVGFALAGR